MKGIRKPVLDRIFTEKQTLNFFILIGAINIAVSAYVGLNGSQVWRQSDAFSQILGFLNERQLRVMTNFFDIRTMYDIPIYQIAVASISKLANLDPLVVARLFNIFFWILLLLSAYGLAEYLYGGSGKYVAFLLTCAPLYIHYYSTPLPDTMALSLAVSALYLILLHPNRRLLLLLSLLCIAISSLIKSPVAFVVVVFYGVFLAVRNREKLFSLPAIAFFAVSLVAVIASELIRLFFLGPDYIFKHSWYFGTLELKTSVHLYRDMVSKILGDAFPRYKLGAALLIATFLCAIFSITQRSNLWQVVLCCIVAMLSGWVVFSDLYYIHDYYQLPSYIFVFMAIGVVGAWVERSYFKFFPRSFFRIALIVLVSVMLVIGKSKRNLSVTSVYDAMSFILQDNETFLYVYDSWYVDDPSMGGLLRTKHRVINTAELERDCTALSEQYKAILVVGQSPCLMKEKEKYRTYMTTDTFQLFVQ